MQSFRLVFAALGFAAVPLIPGPFGEALGQIEPVRVHATVDPAFPLAATNLGLSQGEAEVLVAVDSSGRVTDTLAFAYSHPLFAASALAAVQQWTFEPARLDGQPMAATKELTFRFRRVGAVVFTQTATEHVASRMQGIDPPSGAFRPYNLREIDRPPAPIRVVSPAYPEALRTRGVEGTVVLSYFVDEAGQVRMPMVTNEVSPLLAALAIDAVQQWRYAPPTRRGHPILIRVRQEFHFVAQP